MTIQTALQQGTKLMEDGGITAPRLTAEVLLCYAIGVERSWLYAHGTDELREVWWIHYGRYLHQRLGGRPTQYITGKQEFYGRDFRVTKDVLIPRSETEDVVEASLEFIRSGDTVADIGCGSGAIAVTLALERGTRTFATDLSEAAVRVAADNSRRLGATVEFVVGDLATCFGAARFDAVVTNPPYIPMTEAPTLAAEVRDHEPHLALFGGEDGLEAYRRLAEDLPRVLKPGGWLVMELAWNAAGWVREIFRHGWTDVEMRRDLSGLPRIFIARNKA
ncbi:MAG: peptide chain release factor N(5)-glutamine methyltransferase [Bryobacteraceae bacterium]